MQRTRVKICGVTCVEDALVAAEAGADAIGLIFHPPASRGICLLTAERIVAALPPFLTPVGLFLDSPTCNVNSVAGRLKLRCVQLHGRETPEQVAELKDLQVIKAIHVQPGKLQEALAPWRAAMAKGLPNLRALVLETGWASARGGTGIENDWDQIGAVQHDGGFAGLPPLILAGGLTPATVGGVVEVLHPWAVDVSSGVEEIKGRKSPQLVAAFIEAVQAADHSRSDIPSP